MVFFFFLSLLTQFSSLITHCLKYPNFLNPTRLDTVFTSHHSNISTFLWDPYLITKSDPSVSLPAKPITHFLHFSLPLHPFNRVPLLKHKPEPIKIEEAQTSISTVTRAASPISPTCTGSVISFVKAQRCRRSVKKRDPFP